MVCAYQRTTIEETRVTLADRVAAVTGDTRGIGREVAKRLHANGTRVAFLDTDATRGVAVTDSFGGNHDSAMFIECDITEEQDVIEAIEAAVHRFGQLDILVNTAGVNTYFDARSPSEAEEDRLFVSEHLATRSAWLCAKHAAPHKGESASGCLIFVAVV
jgi:NAD(P)-dependent dehydrogenase (short-subunit alcohol dehydrogenase family)